MILCADDFGMTSDINRATAELARAGKIDAVSCMVNMPFFTADQLSKLVLNPSVVGQASLYSESLCTDHTLPDTGSASYNDRLNQVIQLGLHFTLAETAGEFRRLVFSACTHRLNREAVYRKLSEQFDRFEEVAGRRPDFIDGHLHIQQLPVIRDALIEFIHNRCADNPPHVRNAAMPLRQCSLKSFFIAAPGRVLKRKLGAAGIPTNNGFGGIYNYADFMRYPQHLEKFLLTVPETGIIMVHPGLDEPWRRAEYDALISDVWKK